MLQDNYSYYVYNSNDHTKGFFVDVAQAENIIQFRRAFNLPDIGTQGEKTVILTTHKHWDHSQGNIELKKEYPEANIKIYGALEDHIPGIDYPITFSDNGKIKIDDLSETLGLQISCISTPCHTQGSVIWYVEDT